MTRRSPNSSLQKLARGVESLRDLRHTRESGYPGAARRNAPLGPACTGATISAVRWGSTLGNLRGRLDDRRDGVIIARVLHERMEPLWHLTQDLP
jgi:hypothetical protein